MAASTVEWARTASSPRALDPRPRTGAVGLVSRQRLQGPAVQDLQDLVSHAPQGSTQPHGDLLRRGVLAHRLTADLRGRPRHRRRRAIEGFEHAGHPHGRRGSPLPGHLAPVARPPWSPARVVGYDLARPDADRARPRPPGPGRPGRGLAARTRDPGRRVPCPRRAQHPVPPRHRGRDQLRARPRHHVADLRQRARDPHRPGTGARHRRGAGTGRHRRHPRHRAPQRGPQRLQHLGAHPPGHGERRPQLRRGLRRGAPQRRVHHAHAGRRGPRLLRT